MELRLHKRQLKTAISDDRMTERPTISLCTTLWSQNDGTILHRYQYILAFSDMTLSKLLQSENAFEKILILPAIFGHFHCFKVNLGAQGRVAKYKADVTQILP